MAFPSVIWSALHAINDLIEWAPYSFSRGVRGGELLPGLMNFAVHIVATTGNVRWASWQIEMQLINFMMHVKRAAFDY
eukprot:scaffold276235_cov19-Prasinocladus_malaysianus.AAC.1